MRLGLAPGAVGGMPPKFQFGLALLLARRPAHLPLLNREPAPTALLSGLLRDGPSGDERGRAHPGWVVFDRRAWPLRSGQAPVSIPPVCVTLAYINAAAGRLLGGPGDC